MALNMLTKRKWLLIGLLIALLGGVLILFGCRPVSIPTAPKPERTTSTPEQKVSGPTKPEKTTPTEEGTSEKLMLPTTESSKLPKGHSFISILNPQDKIPGSRTELIKIAKDALKTKYGESWSNKYYIHEPTVLATPVKHPLLSFEHEFIRVDPALKAPPSNLSLLITPERIYFLSREEFGKFLQGYGDNIGSDQEVIQSFGVYVRLYIGDYPPDFGGATREDLFAQDVLKNSLDQWAKKVRSKYDIDPERFTEPSVREENSHYRLDCFTVSYANMPRGSSATIHHYQVEMSSKGAIMKVDRIEQSQYSSF